MFLGLELSGNDQKWSTDCEDFRQRAGPNISGKIRRSSTTVGGLARDRIGLN